MGFRRSGLPDRSFRGGSGRLDTRLDTPPSINRHHPVSCLARAEEEGVALTGLDLDGAPRRRSGLSGAARAPLHSAGVAATSDLG
jgi:hypothetical protein